MRGVSQDVTYPKTALQNSFDAANPEYNRFSRKNINSQLLIKRKDLSERKKSTSFRILKSKDRMLSMTFLNISNRTISKKMQRQRNIDDGNLFSDEKFKRSEILVSRRKGEDSKMPEILTQRSYQVSLPKQSLISKSPAEISPFKQRRQTVKKSEIEDDRSFLEYHQIFPEQKERLSFFVKRENVGKKYIANHKRKEMMRINDINRWEKEDFVMEPTTTIQQYIADKTDMAVRKMKVRNSKKVMRLYQ